MEMDLLCAYWWHPTHLLEHDDMHGSTVFCSALILMGFGSADGHFRSSFVGA